jgi:hypothetical protein
MKRGSRPKDARLISIIFTKRTATADLLTDEKEKYAALASIATDFEGLHDVSEISSQAAALAKSKSVKDALKHDRDNNERESRLAAEMHSYVRDASRPELRVESLRHLRVEIAALLKKSAAESDSEDRRAARRILRGLAATAFESGGTMDPEAKKLLDGIRQSLNTQQALTKQ